MHRTAGMKCYWPYMVIAAVTFLTFWPCLRADFLNWDDPSHLLDNLFLPFHGGSDVIRLFFSADTANQTYIPLTVFSFGIERLFFGLDPFVFHFNNLLLHALTASLVYVLARRMGLFLEGAVLAALLFAVHPMKVESVAWITERKDVLFGFFYMAALIGYWDYLRSRQGKYYIFALLCAVFSILAKPMALSLPWVFFLFDHMAGRKLTAGMLADKIPFAAALWPVAMVTVLMNGRDILTVPWERILTIVHGASFYVMQFIFPFHNPLIYATPRPISLFQQAYFMGVLFFILIMILGWRWRKDRWVVFSALFYVLTIFFVWPVDLFEGVRGLVKDRFMYIPSVGFVLFLGVLWDKYLKGSFKAYIGAGILIVVLAGISFHRCFSWQDSFVFWSDVLEDDPGNTFALINRASALTEDEALRSRYGFSGQKAAELALSDLGKAALRAPKDQDVWKNMAIIYRRLGRKQESMRAFEECQKVK